MKTISTIALRPIALTFLLALLSGCAGADFRVAHLPARDGSTSSLVKYAYFSTIMYASGSGIAESQLPGGYREFDPAKDEQVVFVVAINTPGKDFSLRGSLSRPDGVTAHRFRRNFTASSRWTWYYASWPFSMADLKAYPGEWKADLHVDGEQVGTYSFVLGDQQAMARLKREKTVPALATAATSGERRDPPPVEPPSITLRLAGPPGTEVRINAQRHVLDPASGTLTVRYPPGTYVLEVAKPGFVRWHETVVLSAQQPAVDRAIILQALTPPSLTVLEPPLNAVFTSEAATIKVQVTSPHRLRLLRVISREQGDQGGFEPTEGLRAGEPWIVAANLKLVVGSNHITVVVTDEHGERAETALSLIRRTVVAVDVRGPPGVEVRVKGDRFRLDSQGRLALQLPAGTYEIAADKEGFLPWRDTLTVASEPVVRSITLTPRPAPGPPVDVLVPPARALDVEAPRIVINHPLPDSKVEAERVTVVALVTDNVGVQQVQISLNGVAVAAETPATKPRGHPVRASVVLQPGENVIEVNAIDTAGNVAQAVRTVMRIVPAAVAPVPLSPERNRWAVVIGIGGYAASGIPSLQYSVPDAEAIYAALTGPMGLKKDHVLLLTDKTERKPTLRNIRWALGTFLSRSARKDDTVLIFFAGHGAPEVDPRGFERDGLARYLVPADAEPDDLYSTAFPMDELHTIFGRIESERVVVFLDACYSGAAGGRTFRTRTTRSASDDDFFLERLTRSKGRAIVTASRPSELSMELAELGHGLFTYYLLAGLRGGADLNRDGIVSLHELYEYVAQEVGRKARQVGGNQHPVMKGEMEGILPLSKVR